jgi:hypothetical protein
MTQFSDEIKVKQYETLLHTIDLCTQTANDGRLAELIQNICSWSHAHRSNDSDSPSMKQENDDRINNAFMGLLASRGLGNSTLQSHIQLAWLLLYDAKCSSDNPFVIEGWNSERARFLENFKGFIKYADELLNKQEIKQNEAFKFDYYDKVQLCREVYTSLPFERCSTTGSVIDRFVDDFGDNYYEVEIQINDYSSTLVTCKEDEINLFTEENNGNT